MNDTLAIDDPEELADTGPGLLDLERCGNTLVVMPRTNLREGLYQEIEQEENLLGDLVVQHAIRNIVVDFAGTDFFGSSALGFLIHLRKLVHGRGGHMALCNVSAHETEILNVTRLDQFWPICATRSDALQAIEMNQG